MSLKYIRIVSDKLINYLAPFWPSQPSLSWRWRKKYFANIETSYQRIKCVKRQKKIDSWKTFNRFRPYRRDSSDISLDPSFHTCFVVFRSQNPGKKITSITSEFTISIPTRTASSRHESNEAMSVGKIFTIYETECASVISNNKNRGKLTDLARAVTL